MWESNLGANIFQIGCSIWVGFSSLGQGDNCAQLIRMDSEKKLVHMLLAP